MQKQSVTLTQQISAPGAPVQIYVSEKVFMMHSELLQHNYSRTFPLVSITMLKDHPFYTPA